MADSTIEWTDKVWNATRGCSRVSPGCGGARGEGGCYAERQAARFCGPGGAYEGLVRLGKQGPRWTGVMRLAVNKLSDPLRWRKPQKVFVNSMSDLFHEGLTNEEIAAVFGAMSIAHQHTFQVLTKRARRMAEWFKWVQAQGGEHMCLHAYDEAVSPFFAERPWERPEGPPVPQDRFGRWIWPLPNVWIGVSVEDQKRAEERIPWLLEVPSAVRFLSCEPLLGPIDLENVEPYFVQRDRYPHDPQIRIDALRGHVKGPDDRLDAKVDWVIVGSESGPGARPMDIAWARGIVDQCVGADTSVFVKQIANIVDRKGGNPQHWPAGNWPRQFPRVA